ncbi:hypothetical protein KIN20_001907 [Parelaphostrongylus tenuis]|uniref:Uncharacterized protein n=1 Tax=Parelaphostrongylus tenuis TaxID=148309 RepID=A0AAD5MDF7_PARTN|nr:hypothetical protein KIN20_001907 [Parelaphostrongylus tenuis]
MAFVAKRGSRPSERTSEECPPVFSEAVGKVFHHPSSFCRSKFLSHVMPFSSSDYESAEPGIWHFTDLMLWLSGIK